MRKALLVLLVLPLAACGAAPTDPARDFKEPTESAEAYQTLYALTSKVGHRLSGTENGRKAEEFALERFKEYGLSDVKAEPFEHLGWTRGATSFLILDPRRQIEAVALGNTPRATLTAEIVSCGYGSPADFQRAGDTLKGKIVLVTSEPPEGAREVHRIEKMSLCAKAGAAAMIMASRHAGVIQTGAVAVGKLSPLTAVCIKREDAEQILELLKAGKSVRAQLEVGASSGPVTARNVSAQIRGGEKAGEVVLVGAHLDSWDLATGTIDNGTGVAILLEAARVLASAGRPQRTIRFVLFMGEELGLYGSKAYVKAHASELGQIVMMINMDSIGKPTGFQIYACDEALPFFKNLTETMKLPKPVECKAGLHSDHQPFMLAGVPSMTIRSDLDPEQSRYYHSAGDHFSRAKREHLDAASRALTQTIQAIAATPTRPAPWLVKDMMRDRMIRDGVREPLELTGEWPY